MSALEDFIARSLRGNAPSVIDAAMPPMMDGGAGYMPPPQQPAAPMGGFAFPQGPQRRGVFGAPMATDAPGSPGQIGGPLDITKQPGGATGDPRIDAIKATPNAVNRQLAANEVARKPSFFGQGGTGRAIVGNLGDALQTIGGGKPTYGPAMLERARRLADYQRQQAEWSHAAQVKQDDRDYDANKPQYFNAGNDRVRYDPATGSASTIYDAPEAFQEYASQFGDPDTPEYKSAMQDYILRSNGPTAFGYDANLEGVRQDNRETLEGIRYGNRSRLRSQPTYGDLHPRTVPKGGARGGTNPTMAGVIAPILAKTAQGQPLSAGEQQAFEMWRRRGSGGGRGGSSAPSNPPSMVPGTTALPVTVTSPDQAKMLPKGTWFTVNGKTYQRH